MGCIISFFSNLTSNIGLVMDGMHPPKILAQVRELGLIIGGMQPSTNSIYVYRGVSSTH